MSLKKVRPEIQVHFNEPLKRKKRDYKDKFPKGMKTLEDVKKEYGTVVWCKYLKCKNNKEVEGLQRTSGTILGNRAYNPINEQEHVWEGICTKSEIAIKYDEIVTASGTKFKVPSCFSAVTGVSGHIDFSRLLQPDGSPFGGSIESQSNRNTGY